MLNILHQELQLNGSAVPSIRPFSQQMGMNGNGNYNDMARMAMSHPAFLDHQGERPQVVFGSHSQFEVSRHLRVF